MRSGQVSLEYLAVVGLALLLATPIIVEAQTSSQEFQASFGNAVAGNALDTMEEAARLVNDQGPPARVQFNVRLPDGITQTNVTDTLLRIERRTATGTAVFVAPLPFSVSGSIPVTGGVHTMEAEATADNVTIGPA